MASTPVFAGRRVALVVGNAAYADPQMRLVNPSNDATDVGEALTELGFEVTTATNLNLGRVDGFDKVEGQWIPKVIDR